MRRARKVAPIGASEVAALLAESSNGELSEEGEKCLESIIQLAADKDVQTALLKNEHFHQIYNTLNIPDSPSEGRQSIAQPSRVEEEAIEHFSFSNALNRAESSSPEQREDSTSSTQQSHPEDSNSSSENAFEVPRALPILPSSESEAEDHSSSQDPPSSSDEPPEDTIFQRIWGYVRSIWSWMFGQSSPPPMPEPDELLCQNLGNEDTALSSLPSLEGPGNPPNMNLKKRVGIIVGVAVILVFLAIQRKPHSPQPKEWGDFARLLMIGALSRFTSVKFIPDF